MRFMNILILFIEFFASVCKCKRVYELLTAASAYVYKYAALSLWRSLKGVSLQAQSFQSLSSAEILFYSLRYAIVRIWDINSCESSYLFSFVRVLLFVVDVWLVCHSTIQVAEAAAFVYARAANEYRLNDAFD